MGGGGGGEGKCGWKSGKEKEKLKLKEVKLKGCKPFGYSKVDLLCLQKLYWLVLSCTVMKMIDLWKQFPATDNSRPKTEFYFFDKKNVL